MRQQGLIRGASAENAIVLTKDGIMNPPLRFSDEFVRHKVLDLIGDLALLGKQILGNVVADRAGQTPCIPRWYPAYYGTGPCGKRRRSKKETPSPPAAFARRRRPGVLIASRAPDSQEFVIPRRAATRNLFFCRSQKQKISSPTASKHDNRIIGVPSVRRLRNLIVWIGIQKRSLRHQPFQLRLAHARSIRLHNLSRIAGGRQPGEQRVTPATEHPLRACEPTVARDQSLACIEKH